MWALVVSFSLSWTKLLVLQDSTFFWEKIKEQIKQELVVEMQMQNMQMQRWCCQQMVLSQLSNRASPSPATLKSSYASADVRLIDGTVELATEVRCDDRTHEDLIGMLTEPTHCVLWIMWWGFTVRLHLVLFIQRRLRYKQSQFMKTVLWLKRSLYILSLRMNFWNTLLMTR
jgi:DNA-directed RNA polymerase subunit N (RpoN/RPB10)